MNIEQKIKRHILINAVDVDIDLSTADLIDETWEIAENYEGAFSQTEIIDKEEDFRCGGQPTNLTCDARSRHYESEQVAIKLSDGTYVSWVYWSGGGKHGEPDGIDWMDSAFEVDREESEQLVTIYKFSRKSPSKDE